MRRSILVNLVVLLCMSVVTSGATRLVPSEYSTIQGAIDAANDGDTVIVAPGTYYENINLKGKDVVLRSKDPHNPRIVAATVIDGNEKGTVVTFDSGEDANCVLDGFTVAHGIGSLAWELFIGGGIHCSASSPAMSNCVVTSCFSVYGGGMCNTEGSKPMVSNCSFTRNFGIYGGGMYNAEGSDLVVSKCSFDRNESPLGGGGMYNRQSSPTLYDCSFTHNGYGLELLAKGGGMYNGGSSPTLRNCIFVGNLAGWGGGIFNTVHSRPVLTNCTFAENRAEWGGGICNMFKDAPVLTNCILWGDIGGEIEWPTFSMVVSYSDVQGRWRGEGNIDWDPCFVRSGWDANGTPDYLWDDFWVGGDYHLRADSPCINAGDPCYVVGPDETDIDGQPRVICGLIDMGAYEYQGECPLRVHNMTQDTYHSKIQEAIDDADDGDEIIVSPGTYCENIDFLGKNIVVHSADPTNPSVVSKTRIDGRQLGSVVTFEGMESAACLLSGFTICNGAVRDWPLAGGGIYGNGTLATIEYNIIMKNRVCPFFWPHSGYGGGLYDCDGTIRYNTVSKNHVCCYEGVAGGGGLFGCDGIIQSNIVSNNEAIGPGFANGGGFSNCNGSIENNTIVGNRAEYGGALSGCSGSIKSCIIWQNLSDEYGPQIHESNTPAYSCIGDWPGGGTGNTSNDPCFVRAGYWDAADPDIPWDDFWVEGDYHLLPDSPCINAGDPNYVGEAGERDMDGQPRVIGGRVDMGADEFVIEVTVKFTPGALNPCSKGKWVKAHLVLPEEYGVEDVNTNSPARIMLPVEIESEHMNVFVNEDGLVEVEAAFARAGLCEAGIDDGAIELGVIGWFTNGLNFYGEDTVRIVTGRLKCLADFASYWLQGDCDKPDWCGGLDVSRDSVVNFVDFAMLEGCCM